MSEEIEKEETPKNNFEVETIGKKSETKEDFKKKEKTEEVNDKKLEQNDNDQKEEVGTENQPKKSRAQKRIEKLAAEKRELAKRVKELEEAQSGKTDDEELDPDDFESYDDYLDAVSKNTDDKKKDKKNSNNSIDDDFQKVLDEIEVKFDDARDKYEDFDELVQKQPKDGGPHITVNMVEAINEVDNSGDVAYELAKDVNESIRISKLSPAKQIIAIGKLSDKLLQAESKQEEKTEAKGKKVTSAPEPINVIGGSETIQKTLSNVNSFQEYEALRKQQDKRSSGW